MSELKPCPFCGCAARLMLVGADYAVVCTECHGAIFPFSEQTEEDAIRFWNHRAQSIYDEEWRKEHYKTSYDKGFLEGYRTAQNAMSKTETNQ